MILGMSKIDASLALALSQASSAKAADFGQGFDVTILVEKPLSKPQVRELEQLGIVADQERTVFVGTGTKAVLEQLAKKKCVARISLAQPLEFSAGGLADAQAHFY